MNGKRILVTGGTTGIGREAALQLAALGANVLVVGLDEQHLHDTLSNSRSAGDTGSLNGVIADVSTPEGIAKIFETADSLFDGGLDVLVNNAALAYQSVLEGSYGDWQRVINTNLLGYIACAHHALARMDAAAGTGHIVNIGSMSADVREKDSSVYVATKAGIQGFTESLRKEVNERGIKVTLIEPGAVDTDMQPDPTEEKKNAVKEGTMLKAADIAKSIIYALSQEERCDVVEIRIRPHLQII